MSGDASKEDEALAGRLDAVSAALERRKADARAQAGRGRAPPGGAMATGMRAMSEMVVAVTLGAGGGWLLDRQLGSGPWLLILGLAVGAVAGFWGVYRLAARTTPPAGPG